MKYTKTAAPGSSQYTRKIKTKPEKTAARQSSLGTLSLPRPPKHEQHTCSNTINTAKPSRDPNTTHKIDKLESYDDSSLISTPTP
jgi:hypothetical protein